MLTLQEIFDTVYQHFVYDNGRPSIDDEGNCLYRGEDGQRCAVGLIIPDEQYTAELEGTLASQVLRSLVDKHGSTSVAASIPLVCRLDELQFIHDTTAQAHSEASLADFNSVMRDKLEAFAVVNELDIPCEQ